MKKNTEKYLSKVAQSINPYQWEEGIAADFLRFDTNTLPFPPKSLPFFLKNMVNCPINEYTDPAYIKLKKLIADYESVEPDMITVTNSGDEAIDILAKTFLNPGEYFITTPPTYEMFTIQCEINKGLPLPVPLNKNTWEVDKEEIIKRSKKNPKVKLIFLVNPNNPTASIVPEEIIEEIAKSSSAIVVVDEAYREFYGKSSLPLLNKFKNLVILRSLSKFAAMAGARIGYLVSNQFLSQKFDSIRFPMGVSYFSYKFAEIVLENDRSWIKQQIKMIKKERVLMGKKLENFGFYVFPSAANFLLVKIGKRAKEVCRKLKQRGIIVRDRSSKKYLSGCVRITVRSPKENKLLINQLKEVLYDAKD